jgi:short-subunit dehydrogenase
MNDKVVVITGASSGIGAVLAEKLAAKGYRIALAARSEEKLYELADRIGENAFAVVTDVTIKSDQEKLRDMTLEQFGRIDVWINNAGQGVGKTWTEISEEDMDAIFAVNFKSVFYSIQTIITYFKNHKKGHLINVSSFLGKVPFVTFRSAYNAAKSAVNSLTSGLRIELALTCPEIDVTLVLPGAVSTDFSKNALYGTPTIPGLGKAPFTMQTPEEVADIIISAIENPKPEIYTNPNQAEQAAKYIQDVGAYEENLINLIKSMKK